jgi:hypothetical protein
MFRARILKSPSGNLLMKPDMMISKNFAWHYLTELENFKYPASLTLCMKSLQADERGLKP